MRPSVTLALAGDVMLGRGVTRRIAEHGEAYPWGNMRAVIQRADCFLINLECAITGHRKRWRDSNNGLKAFYFRAQPHTAETLRLAHVCFAALANNHAADYEMAGLLDTIGHLDAAGIAYAGAGADAAAARAPAYIMVGDWRVGIVAFADYPESWAAGEAAPGINYAPVSLAKKNVSAIERSLSLVREQADLVIFSIHWGPNMRERPTSSYRDFARAVIEAGADVFWGHSAHLVQGIEIWQGKPILYDTGDFVDDYAVDARLRNDLSALFLLRTIPPHVESIELVPVVIRHGQVNQARGTDRDWFAARFSTLCAELGTEVEMARGRIVIHRETTPG
jgi:poly-gamma-glutamate synthesis protein (capsule biosynthesis protein)